MQNKLFLTSSDVLDISYSNFIESSHYYNVGRLIRLAVKTHKKDKVIRTAWHYHTNKLESKRVKGRKQSVRETIKYFHTKVPALFTESTGVFQIQADVETIFLCVS